MRAGFGTQPGCAGCFGAAWLFVLALALSFISGCGMTAHQVRLATITASAEVIGTSAELVERVVTAEAEACRRPPVIVSVTLDVGELVGPLDETCVAEVERRWAPAETFFDSMRVLMGTWLAIEAFGGGEESFSATAVEMLRLYGQAFDIAHTNGHDIPALVIGGAR